MEKPDLSAAFISQNYWFEKIPFYRKPWLTLLVCILFCAFSLFLPNYDNNIFPIVNLLIGAMGMLGIIYVMGVSLMVCISSVIKKDIRNVIRSIGVGILAFLAFFLFPFLYSTGSLRTWRQNRLQACEKNLRNLSVALEMYSCENMGRYPTSLASLKPQYIKEIPTCPAAKKDTYSGSYLSQARPDIYTLYCKGTYHRRQVKRPDYPRYDSISGLIEK